MGEEAVWYYSTGGQEKVGPMTWEAVEAAKQAGTIHNGTMVWAPHLPTWVQLGTLMEPAPPAPPPPPMAPPVMGAPAMAAPSLGGAGMQPSYGMQIDAPGAKASLNCGIGALVTALFCFPASVVLAIFAITNGNKAQRMAEENPQAYLKPGTGGKTMAIIALAVLPVLAIIGIISAIAIPALLSQRARARDKTAIYNMEGHLGDLVGEWDKGKELGRPESDIKTAMETSLQQTTANEKNPWNEAVPAYSYTIAVTSGQTADSFEEAVREQVTELGQAVYYIQYPAVYQPGYIVGAVRINGVVKGSSTVVKVAAIE